MKLGEQLAQNLQENIACGETSAVGPLQPVADNNDTSNNTRTMFMVLSS